MRINNIKKTTALIIKGAKSIEIIGGGITGLPVADVITSETINRVIRIPVQLPNPIPIKIKKTCSTKIILKLWANVIPIDLKVPILDLI